MRATVKDVARRAGVSPKTVSNVINGTFPVSPPMRAKVEQALAELDYVPNLSARGLRNGRTGLIALALPDLSTPYSAEMAHHFVTAAGSRGLSVQIQETATSDERERELVLRARAHLIDGLILNPVLLSSAALHTTASLPPTVFIGEVEQTIADHVWIDNVGATREMTTLLINQGHQRIAVLGVMDSESSRLRTEGYHQALTAAGRPIDPELEIDNALWSAAGGARSLEAYLVDHEPPDAIVCFTDSLALGVLSALWAHGLRVPDDVSVVGYDNVVDGEYAVPPLTTVDFDKVSYAETALALLTERIADPDRPIRKVTMPHRILQRGSTRSRR